MSFGYADLDHPANRFRTTRAAVDDAVTVVTDRGDSMSVTGDAATALRHTDRLFVGGEWVVPSSTAMFDVDDSSTERTFLRVVAADAADMDRAVTAARTAFDDGPWRRLTHAERAGYLRAIHAGLVARGAEITDMWPRESGVVRSVARVAAPGFAVAAELRSGTVGHNAMRSDMGVAFGGFKQSGTGREGGREGLLPCLETKTVILDGPPARYRDRGAGEIRKLIVGREPIRRENERNARARPVSQPADRRASRTPHTGLPGRRRRSSAVKPYRSMLFVPGHKASWANKAIASGTDAVILDLEDSVPATEKAGARTTVRDTLGRLHADGVRADVWVRPNPYTTPGFAADVEEIVVPGLAGLFLPKVFDAEEIVRIDAVLSHVEAREGLPDRGIGLIVSFETAVSMAHCEQIAAASPRVSGLLGATGPNADVGRELGFEFTPEGLESLYLRSRIVLASRAAGLHHPVTGVWQDIKDADGFRRFATDARRLGYRGMVCFHPSHVALSHEVFTPSAETVAYSRRLIEAFREAEAAGSAAVDFEGQHVDIAHVKTAEGIIALADAIGLEAAS